MSNYKKVVIFFCGIIFFSFACSVYALGFNDIANFNVEKNFDLQGRSQITAELVKTSSRLYYYVEKTWWDSQSSAAQDNILSNFNSISEEFENKIYPNLTSVFGSEWNPGVDGDSRITLLFEPMNSGEGGYFRTADEYIKLQLPNSNEREMLYLSTDLANSPKLKAVLAHEFVHLITFNQKNKNFNIEEDTWLNEGRADYSSTILGYDDNYQGSNLQSRVKDFLEMPSDSVTEWQGTKYDYASLSMFLHYMIDHYGINVLIDSLKSKYTGIESINYALEKIGAKENFSDIFTNWTIAATVNDCSLGMDYCYLNTNLKNFRLSPTLVFLPVLGSNSLTTTNVTKNWSGNWQKIIGGKGELTLDFSGLKGLDFKVPYILIDKNNKYTVKFLALNEEETGKISVPDFSGQNAALIVMPSLQTKTSGFDGADPTYPYTLVISTQGSGSSGEQTLIQQLMDQIEALKQQIADLQKQLGGEAGSEVACSQLSSNLYFGMSNNAEVRCLQEFLKDQEQDIYPEGLVTGYFGNLTQAAVIRFQEKYASEILNPLGLYFGTGFVGPSTRAKINQLL